MDAVRAEDKWKKLSSTEKRALRAYVDYLAGKGLGKWELLSLPDIEKPDQSKRSPDAVIGFQGQKKAVEITGFVQEQAFADWQSCVDRWEATIGRGVSGSYRIVPPRRLRLGHPAAAVSITKREMDRLNRQLRRLDPVLQVGAEDRLRLPSEALLLQIGDGQEGIHWWSYDGSGGSGFYPSPGLGRCFSLSRSGEKNLPESASGFDELMQATIDKARGPMTGQKAVVPTEEEWTVKKLSDSGGHISIRGSFFFWSNVSQRFIEVVRDNATKFEGDWGNSNALLLVAGEHLDGNDLQEMASAADGLSCQESGKIDEICVLTHKVHIMWSRTEAGWPT